MLAQAGVRGETYAGPALIMFGGRDAAGFLGDIWFGALHVDESTGQTAVDWQPVECAGSGPGPRCYHASTLLRSPGSGTPTLLVIHGGMSSPVARGPDDEAGLPLFRHGRLMGRDALHVLNLSTLTWSCIAPRLPGTLQPRMSHCLVDLPEAHSAACGLPEAVHRLLLLGGGVRDPTRCGPDMLTIKVGVSFDLSLESRTLMESSFIAGNTAADTLPITPLMLRAAALVVPSPVDQQTTSAGPRILVVGGGCVAFAFGSYPSPTCESVLPLVDTSRTEPRVDAVLMQGEATLVHGVDEAAELIVSAADAQRVRLALLERGWFDSTRRCHAVVGGSAVNEKRISMPVTATGAGFFHRGLSSVPLGAAASLSGSRLAFLLYDESNRPLEGAALSVQPHADFAHSHASAASVSTSLRNPRRCAGDSRGGADAMARAARALLSLIDANTGLVTAEAAGRLVAPGSPGGLPRRTEWVGNVLVLPHDAMTDPIWVRLRASDLEISVSEERNDNLRLVSAPVWDCLARVFGADRIARAAMIDPGATRRSRLTLLRYYEFTNSKSSPVSAASPPPTGVDVLQSVLPPLAVDAPIDLAPASGPEPPPTREAQRQQAQVLTVLRTAAALPGGWTLVREAGVTYVLDVTRLMLSSGNISEKQRVGALPAAGETVVDLYAGIGYWTLPLLVRARVAHVHACDWNPDAIACLRLGIAANHISPTRVTLWPGDNAQLRGSAVEGTADRVVLGLIPSSQGSWGTALRVLRPGGGWLHVHANRAEEGVATYAEELEGALATLAAEAGRQGWSFKVRHVERVKSYAPRVWHCVYDVEGRPPMFHRQ